jgi:hypothetical protein
VDDYPFTDMNTLKPSSSTETESGYFDEEVNIDTPLNAGQRTSDRLGSSAEKKWIQTYVQFDYTAGIEEPSWHDRILARVTNQRITGARSVWVPRPAVGEKEWSRLQALFHNFWLTLAAVSFAWAINQFLIITKLGAGWRGARRKQRRLANYVE